MRYEIVQEALKPNLTLAKISVLDDDNIVVFYGEQEVCLPTGDAVVSYIESVYLVDQRRQPINSSLSGLQLKEDIEKIKTYSSGLVETNKGWVLPDGYDKTGWTTFEYAGETFYLPPENWTAPTEG